MTIPAFTNYPLTNTTCNDANKANRNLADIILFLTSGDYDVDFNNIGITGLTSPHLPYMAASGNLEDSPMYYASGNFWIPLNSWLVFDQGAGNASIVQSSDSVLDVYIGSSPKGTFTGDGLTLPTINHETTDVDKFLVSNSGLVKYRTGSELLSDRPSPVKVPFGDDPMYTFRTLSLD
jgi:hypothetical protein